MAISLDSMCNAPRHEVLADPLRYHGDQAAYHADLDFAVNVRGTTPEWLQHTLADALSELAAYPSAQLASSVRAAIAAHHGRAPEEVLLLHGVAEAFSLLPHCGLAATIVQPQFTEPEAAFRNAGVEVDSLVLPAPFVLADSTLDDARGLSNRMVIIGNPTNPTGVAHSASQLRRLAGRCAVLVVDEAFMDVADEETIARCSLADRPTNPTEPAATAEPAMPANVIVLRSMTKTWAIAGLRCGYALGAPELLDKLALLRPHWPLGTLQLVAMAEIARREAELLPAIRCQVQRQRKTMAELLSAAGWRVLTSEAPFVLAKPGEWAVERQERARLELLARGVAVRRCDTFTGLDGSWWRLAVRGADDVRRLIAEVRRVAR